MKQTKQISVRRPALWLSAVSLAAFVVAALPAQAQPKNGDTYGDWVIACQTVSIPAEEKGEAKTENRCSAAQRLVDADNQNVVMQTALGYLPDAASPVLVVTLPLGIRLRPGIAMVFADGKVAQMRFDFCFQGGCQSRLTVPDDLLALLTTGEVAQVGYQLLNGQNQFRRLSLKGLPEALNALKPAE